MRWFRLRQRWGSYLALAALVFQLAIACSHVHLDHAHLGHAESHAGDAAIAAGADHGPEAPSTTRRAGSGSLRDLRADPSDTNAGGAHGADPGAARRVRTSRAHRRRNRTDGAASRALPSASTSHRLTSSASGVGACRRSAIRGATGRPQGTRNSGGSFRQGMWGFDMLIRNRRWVFLSSSALAIACCLASGAQSQTTSEPAPAPTPAPTPAPAPTPPAAQTPPAPTPTPTPAAEAPQTPTISVPPVTVTAPPPPRRPGPARPAQAAPARVTPAPATPPVTPTTTPRASTQPYAPLGTITSGQIQQTPTQNFGDVFFTQPGATSSTFAPGASRPILRGLSDSRVRVQENGVGTADVADLSQDHAVPIDPLAIQKIEIYRGPAALRYGSQAIGGIVEAINNRIPTMAPFGGVAAETEGRPQQRRQRLGERAAARRRLAQRRDPCRRLRTPHQQLLDPELSVSVPAGPAAGGERPAAELVAHRRERIGWRLVAVRRRLCRRRGQPLHHRLSDPRPRSLRAAVAHPAGADQDHQQGRIPAVAFAGLRYPLLGRLHRLQAPRARHSTTSASSRLPARSSTARRRARSRSRHMPMSSPFGAWTSFFGAQGSHQQLDTSGEALLFPARTRVAAAYWFNEFAAHADNCVRSSRSASRTSRSTAPPVNFPANFLPPPDDPEGFARSVSFAPKSVSYSLIQDLPSYMVASFNLQRIERAPRAVELFAKGPHDATQTFDIGNPNLDDRDCKHRRDRPQARARRLPLRRQGLLHALQQLHLSAADRNLLRRGVRHLRHRDRAAADRHRPARCDLPRRGAGVAMGCRSARAWPVRRRRPIRHGAGDVHGRQQRAAHSAAAPRRRRLLAQRQLVRPRRPAARVRAVRSRAVRDADRRLQPGQGRDRSQTISGATRRGGRSSSPPASSATTCSTSTCATASSSTRTRSCFPAAA